MTINGNKYSIKHPGYDDPAGFQNRKYDFVFSDDIGRWMGKQFKERREKDRIKQKRNYKPARKK